MIIYGDQCRWGYKASQTQMKVYYLTAFLKITIKISKVTELYVREQFKKIARLICSMISI